MPTLTFILNIHIGQSSGYRNLYCSISFGQKWTMCKTKGLSKAASKRHLSKLWMSSNAATHGIDSYSTYGRGAQSQLRDSAQQIIDLSPRLL